MATKTPSLTPVHRRILSNAVLGLDINLGRALAHGSREDEIQACVTAGWLNKDHEITSAGTAALRRDKKTRG